MPSGVRTFSTSPLTPRLKKNLYNSIFYLLLNFPHLYMSDGKEEFPKYTYWETFHPFSYAYIYSFIANLRLTNKKNLNIFFILLHILLRAEKHQVSVEKFSFAAFFSIYNLKRVLRNIQFSSVLRLILCALKRSENE